MISILNSRRAALRTFFSALGLAAVFGLFGTAAADPLRPVVVELFTSQGCSSCPPAERNLAQLADDPSVIALAYHVEYWDYIGWKDPYGLAVSTERQKRYRQWLRGRYLYTPQMVVAGRYDVVGSNSGSLKRSLSDAAEEPGFAIEVRPANGGILLTLPESDSYRGEAQVLCIVYLQRAVTEVARGENAGRTLTERNIVRAVHYMGSWAGSAKEIRFDHALDADHGVAWLVQDSNSGAILAAAKHEPAQQ